MIQWKSCDEKDCVEPSAASGQSEPPFALVAEHLDLEKAVKMAPSNLAALIRFASSELEVTFFLGAIVSDTGHKALCPVSMLQRNSTVAVALRMYS